MKCLMYEPAVIFTTIKDIFYIDRIIPYLVKDKIPFFNKHLVIFVWRDIHFLKKWGALRQMDGYS